MGIVPLLSVGIALLFRRHWSAGMLAGFTYFLYTPILFIHGNRVEKKRKKLLEELQERESIGNNN